MLISIIRRGNIIETTVLTVVQIGFKLAKNPPPTQVIEIRARQVNVTVVNKVSVELVMRLPQARKLLIGSLSPLVKKVGELNSMSI